jgi:DNA-binding NtrC family response regulator
MTAPMQAALRGAAYDPPAPAPAQTALILTGPDTQEDLADLLRARGYSPVPYGSERLRALRQPVSLCVVDLRRNGDAIRAVRQVRAECPKAIILGVADTERPTAAADAIRAGVFDVLPRPASGRDLDALLENATELSRLAAAPAPSVSEEAASFGIVGSSMAMRLVMDLVQRAAAARCGILISGERGSGREMIARAIHAHDPNPESPFVAVDCSGLSPERVELQLFGASHDAGSPVSHERRPLERIRRDSQLYAADGGIIFLENVIELPARAQARLARVLRDREIFLDHEREPQTIDVRAIASVDSAVEGAVEDGRLRPDLFERLSLIRMELPSLRQRREDIPVLATHIVKELCRANGLPLKTLTRPALTLLSALPWRGNLPELRGLLERLILLVPTGLIRLEDVLAHTQLEGSASPTGLDATLRQARSRFERDYIAAVLQHHHGRIAEAARVLGIQRTNLYRKMRQLNLMRGRTGSGGA